MVDCLLLPVGTAGDVIPLLSLARALAARGHRVRVATNPLFLSPTPGVELEPIGTADEFLQLLNDPDIWHPWRSAGRLIRLIGEQVEGQYALAMAQAGRGGLTIGGSLALGARCAEEAHAIPYASVHLQPISLWNPADPPRIPGLIAPPWMPRALVRLQMNLAERLVADTAVNSALAPLRGRLGLPRTRHFMHWWHADGLSLAMFPAWFGSTASDARVLHVGFPLGSQSDGLPDDVERFLTTGSPPIVITPGSGQRHASAELAASIAAVQRLGRRGLVLTRFSEQMPKVLPPGIWHSPWSPLGQLLPRCAALIHHGGIGTTSQGLAAGVPQLILPRAYDQPDNAARVTRLGTGLTIPAARAHVGRISEHVNRLLTDPRFSRAGAIIRQRMASENGLESAVSAVESFARQRGLH